MKRWLIILICATLVLSLVLVAARKAGTWLTKSDDPVNADAMIVLMGSFSDRLLQAAELYLEGFTSRLIMVETLKPDRLQSIEKIGGTIVSNTMQTREVLISMGFPRDSITILPGGARSTQAEAKIIRDYLRYKPYIDTILLVSSADHMRRASMIFETAVEPLDHDIHFHCIPSIYSEFEAQRWWKDYEDIGEVVMEYLKIMNFKLFEKHKLKN